MNKREIVASLERQLRFKREAIGLLQDEEAELLSLLDKLKTGPVKAEGEEGGDDKPPGDPPPGGG